VKFPDLYLALITNGTTINSRVSSMLMERNISWIVVSVDAATPATYRRIRGGRFERVISGVKTLSRIREAHNNSWKLILSFSVMQSNLDEICAFVDMADQLGVEFSFNPVAGDWHNESFSKDIDDVKQVEASVQKLEEHLLAKGKSALLASRLRMLLVDLQR